MFDEKTTAAPFAIIIVLLFIASVTIARGDTLVRSEFEKRITEDSLQAGMYYSEQALPCMSKNPDALDETKRFVLDKEVLDAEIANRGQLSCANYSGIKYWVGIYDLDDATRQWTFMNYQPLKNEAFNPKYGQVVVIDDGMKIHRAFIGVSVDAKEANGNLSLTLFCNSTAQNETADFKLIFNRGLADDKGRGIEDAYSYKTNNCQSGHCIKGPGQALPTCQEAWCTYSKDAGAACTQSCECKSFSCSALEKCEDKSQTTLIEGQPCKSGPECGSLYCAYDMRCRKTKDGGIDISSFAFG